MNEGIKKWGQNGRNSGNFENAGLESALDFFENRDCGDIFLLFSGNFCSMEDNETVWSEESGVGWDFYASFGAASDGGRIFSFAVIVTVIGPFDGSVSL